MELFQVLSCNSTVGNCCTNSALVAFMYVPKTIIEIIQIVVPIALIIAGTIQFVQLTINPELKDGFRRILNKFMAAFFVFFIPFIVDAVLSNVEMDSEVASCWKELKSASSEYIRAEADDYIEEEKNGKKYDPWDSSGFDYGRERPTPTPGASAPNQYFVGEAAGLSAAKGQAIVNYASKYIGQKYQWGGYWNGEDPYTPTDCSGFVTAIFKHFGINLPRGRNMFGYDTSLYTVVSADQIQPGDVIMYDGHVGILTGNGNEVIHAAGKKFGVIKSKDYTKCSGHAILGILRIKGV